MVVKKTTERKGLPRNPLDTEADDAATGRKDRRSFFLVIILLGCFSLVALYGAVYLNASIQALFQSAISEGLTWETTRQKLNKLSILSGRVNAPINDVFISQTIDVERKFMRAEYLQFLEVFEDLNESLEKKNHVTGDQILVYLDDVNASLYSMMTEAEFVFTYLQAGQVELATERMALADQLFREANALIGKAYAVVQRVSLERFNHDALSVQKLYALGSVVIAILTMCFIIFVIMGIRMVKTLNHNQRKLAYSRLVLSKTLNSVDDVVLGCNQQGDITEWNHQAIELFGHNLGGRTNILELVPGVREYMKNNIIDIGHGGSVHASHFRAIGHLNQELSEAEQSDLLPDELDGLITIDLTIAYIAIHDESKDESNQKINAFVFTIRDMRKPRRQAAHVARSQAQLRLQLFQNDRIRQELADQAEVLVEAKIKAEASMEAKSRFLAVMSHELRTPMNAIFGFSRILQRGKLKASQEEALKRIMDSSHHLLGIINDILDMSKIESGGLILEHRAVKFTQELRAVVQTFGEASKKKNLRFFTYVDPATPVELIADTTRLRQVITNLLGNAFQFTEQGSVWFRVFPVPSADRCDTDGKPMHLLRFEVHDTGIGMTPEQQERVFDPFIQADTSITRKYGGTGLGLTITQQIIQSFGSSIELTSVIDKGSCFAFTMQFESINDAESDDIPEPLMVHESLEVIVLSKDERFLEWVDYTLKGARGHYQHHTHFDESIVQWWQDMVVSGKKPAIVVDGFLSLYDEQRLLNQLDLSNQILTSCLYLVSVGSESELQAEQVYGRTLYMPIFPIDLVISMNSVISEVALLPNSRAVVQEVPILKGRNILVVDDVLSNRQYLHEILKPTDCSVTLVNSGAEAIELCQIRLFDLILMDIHMPGMNGYDTTQAIKDNRYARKTPIVGLTADTVEAVLADCIEYGMTTCIGKPFSEEELYATISFLLNKSFKDTKKITENKLEDLHFDEIDVEGALDRISHKTNLYQRLITVFLERVDDLDSRMQELVSENSSTETEQYLASIKGTALSVGATALSEKIGLFEEAMQSDGERQLAFDVCHEVLKKTIFSMQTIEAKLQEDL